MSTIRTNAIQILDENRGSVSILEYHNSQKENDPNYYSWLFGGESNIDNFGIGMTQDEIKQFEDFENSIESLNDIRENLEL